MYIAGLLNLSTTAISITTILQAQTSFFALGNSNAISSVDLSESFPTTPP